MLPALRAKMCIRDRYKEDYDNFAWVVSMAPAEDPQIAVAVMIAQGGAAANAAPIAKEVMGAYFQQLSLIHISVVLRSRVMGTLCYRTFDAFINTIHCFSTSFLLSMIVWLITEKI